MKRHVLTKLMQILLLIMAWQMPAWTSDSNEVNVLALVCGNPPYIDQELVKQLKAEHINIIERKQNIPISQDMLKQFHAVLWIETIYDNPYFGGCLFSDLNSIISDKTVRENLKQIKTYVEQGGGLFASSPPPSGLEMLAPYGAVPEYAQVRDDAHAYSFSPDRLDVKGYFQYAWTTDVVKHPATAGVERMFYPTGEMRWDNMYSTCALRLNDPAWTPLVRSMEGSGTALGTEKGSKWVALENKPQVLAAVRDFGKGRVGVLAPDSIYTFHAPYWKERMYGEATTGNIDGIVLEKGDGAQPSGGSRLIVGMLRWLAGNASPQGLGKYDEKVFAEMKGEAPDASYLKWLRSMPPENGNRWFKVFVGARSSYSDGEGTVAEYAAAAKTAGISMLFMTETFESLDKSKWLAFLEDCSKASDDGIKVVPGLDIPDIWGGRYLLLGTRILPSADMLSPDGRKMSKTNYLCLCFPGATTVLHRATTSPLPQEMLKFFQGMSVFTYRKGELEDNSFPAYQFEGVSYSCPIPFSVHETYSPKDIQVEASKGHQMLVAADSLENLWWYLGQHGKSHYWGTPRIQLSDGPVFNSWDNYISVESDEPLTDVRIYDNYTLMRRWKPDAKKFSTAGIGSFLANNTSTLSHIRWLFTVATDAKGRTSVSPFVLKGTSRAYTWRCGDRQNWICGAFPNIYPGVELNQFDLRVPCFGTKEGSSLFPENQFQRGDNLAPRLIFPFSGVFVTIEDAIIDQRYFNALHKDLIYDAKPLWGTSPSRVYTAKARYEQFLALGGQDHFLPMRKQVDITLRRQVDPAGKVFPVFTTLDSRDCPVKGDMSYAYADPDTGKEITGKLEKGEFVDLPKGGRVGGLIALSEGIRIQADADRGGIVGFASPKWVNGSLPAGTEWQAVFTTVNPEEADAWRTMMGLRGKPPYEIDVKQGKLSSLAYVADFEAENYGVAGNILKALDQESLKPLTSRGSMKKDAKSAPLTKYLMPVCVNGVNYNWPVMMLRDGTSSGVTVADDGKELGFPPDVFEGRARARLDMCRTGTFYIGNVIISDAPNLRINIRSWTDKLCIVDVNNPTDEDIEAEIWTSPMVKDRIQGRDKRMIKSGSEVAIRLTPAEQLK